MLDPVEQVCALLLEGATRDYIGEPVSQLEHGLQAAAAATRSGADEETILAALFHDIGHACAPEGTPQMAALGTLEHERHGADYLRRLGFSERVAALVAGHVQAKRFLAWRTPAYLANLSAASIETLRWQGGPMTVAEAEQFEQDPLFKDKLRLRTWDEAAKDPTARVPALDSYRELMRRNLVR